MDIEPRITPDNTSLKALAHPGRMRMLGLLRLDGPSTASRLAERLGLNSGATSYHLRQLALHGFIVEDPDRGDGRDRWWRAAHRSTHTRDDTSPEARDARDAFSQAVAVVHRENVQRAIEERPLLPEQWWRTTMMSDWGLRLSAADGVELLERLVALFAEFAGREPSSDAPDDTALLIYQVQAFPLPGTVAGDPE
jgi:predicted ArsR family transcriptional regulator